MAKEALQGFTRNQDHPLQGVAFVFRSGLSRPSTNVLDLLKIRKTKTFPTGENIACFQ